MTEEEMMRMMGLPVGFGAGSKSNGRKNKKQDDQDEQKHEQKESNEDVKLSSTTQSEPSEMNSKSPDKQETDGTDEQPDLDEDDYGPMLPPSMPTNNPGSNSDLEDDDEVVPEETDILPFAKSTFMKDHSRPVTCISVDPAGSRLATGSRDYMLKLWDFQGRMKPFRSLEPCSGNPLRDVQFSLSGEKILVAPSTSQAKIYDRDGLELLEFAKGDPYLRDMRHTKGHVAALTCARWQPHDKNIFMTASMDSTIRIWDINNHLTQRDVIFVKSKLPGSRTSISSAAFSHDGRLVVGVGADGSLGVWPTRGPFITPMQSIEGAHLQGAGASSVTFASNGYHILTRGMDDTLKLWDLRYFKKSTHQHGKQAPNSSVARVTGLPSLYEEANAIYSPNENYILTGTAVKRRSGNPGYVVVFHSTTLEQIQAVPVKEAAIRLLWPSKLNQVFVGTGTGDVQVLYDPEKSHGGIKSALSKEPRKLAVDDYTKVLPYVPGSATYAEALLATDGSIRTNPKRHREKARHDPNLTKKPQEPPKALLDHGRGGVIGVNLTQHIMRGIVKNTTRSEDPREAILKYAQVAEEDPYWIAPAYKKNQPDAVLAEDVYEDEDEAEREERKKRRQ